MGGVKKKPMTTTSEPIPEYVCPHCGELKKKGAFYTSTDPAVSIGVAFPCKECAEKIARRYNPVTKDFADVTEYSLKNALMYLDKPFINTLWESAYNEVHDETLTRPKNNIWSSYIKNVIPAIRWNIIIPKCNGYASSTGQRCCSRVV